jgi:hypothetical protein
MMTRSGDLLLGDKRDTVCSETTEVELELLE